MKLLGKIIIAAFISAVAAFSYGCKPEQEPQARSVASSETEVTFDAKDAAPATVSIYSDGAWQSDAPEWVTVSPSSASGPAEVSITVADNFTGAVMNLPRTGIVVFRGKSVERQAEITIKQRGDAYNGVGAHTVTEVLALKKDATAKIPAAQVVAVMTKGFVIADGTSALYAIGAKEVKIGDNVSLNGVRTEFNGVPAFNVDELTVTSEGTVTYPAPKTIADCAKDKSEYISVPGSMVSSKLVLPGGLGTLIVLDAPEALGLADVELHKVVLNGYYVGASDASTAYIAVTSFTDNGADESLIPYPLRFAIGKNLNYSTASFATEGKIEPVQGIGYIQYIPFDLANTDDNKKYLLDVSASNPRVTGPWPGDYWLFYGAGAVKAGSEVRIAFEARTSATGHKFWRMEYLDGTVWKVAGTPQVSSEPGEEIIYTQAMNADGKTNVPVMETVKFTKNVEHCQFRFLCVANWQANGAGALPTRNGGSARLSITNVDDDTYRPSITILKEGDGVEIPDKEPIYANLVISEDMLAFEGTPAGPKTVKVSSDYDFTVTTTSDWLTLDTESGLAGEEKTVSVTCAPSVLSVLREGVITVTSESTVKKIRVFQSAAGQTLSPLISIVGGNKVTVLDKAGSTKVTVQSNVAVTAESDAAWLTVTPVPKSKAMVDELGFTLAYEANTAETERVAHVVFKNAGEGLETVLKVYQGGFSWFSDDFSWMQTYADAGGAEDSVGDNNASGKAPNAYTYDPEQHFLAAFTQKGYVDLNPTPNVMYLQKYYLKFGKTGYHSGLQLPAMEFNGANPIDVVLKFDWCAHMTGKGAIDDVQIVVELTGAGVCEGSEAAVSNQFATTQTTGKLEWQPVSLKLKGVTDATRIKIYPVKMGNGPKVAPTQQRWHIDNIKIVNP